VFLALKPALVLVLVLRVVAAPVTLGSSPSRPAGHHSIVLRMRCWLLPRAQRVPPVKSLQPRSPRSVQPRDDGRLLSLRPRFSPIGPATSPRTATCRSSVCLRC
jgi:hypothetical protein